jgi:phosphoribosylformimino-5-aminoimidazole carboxamide ribotide isomerase
VDLIPVIDIRNGITVQAIAGQRSHYRPLRSNLTNRVEPAEILKALRDQVSPQRCYVADLDAIEGRELNRCTIAEMARLGLPLIVDAGVTSESAITDLLELGVAAIVLSSESLGLSHNLPDLVKHVVASQLIYSIDLKHGRLMIPEGDTIEFIPESVIPQIRDAGIRSVIVLDLTAVGTGRGIPTLAVCEQIHRTCPEMHIISGGGVFSDACVHSARQAGLNGLLIASALHDGRITDFLA